jgi:hypothetical protein
MATKTLIKGFCPADLGGDSPSHEVEMILTVYGDTSSPLTAAQAQASGFPPTHFLCAEHNLPITDFVITNC